MKNQILTIIDGCYYDYPLYVRVIDSTHVALSFVDETAVEEFEVYHIAQLKDESYYSKIVDFINEQR